MEDTPEPDYRAASTPLIVPQYEERQEEPYFPMSFDEAPGLEALSAAAAGNFHYIRQTSVPAQSPVSPHSTNNLNFILNPTGPDGTVASPPIDPALTTSPRSIPEIDHFPVIDHEVAFLLRHFGETTGQWMDLFDLGCYFAHQVPVRAISNPLLRYSACAYAAKQLGRVRGRKSVIGGIVSKEAEMEQYPRPETVDWAYIGAKYYDRGLSLLMEELKSSGSSDFPTTPMTEAFSPEATTQSPQSLSSSQANKRRRLSRVTNHNSPDDTLAAAAILCVYEFLDNATTAWARHLSGTKSLFDLAEKEGASFMMPVESPTSPGALSQRIKPSRARKATFWNFARQDFLAAFINEGQTRLNTEDIGLWRAAGLHLDDQSFVIPSNNDQGCQAAMKEDMISNALIWLMSKIINYLASGDSIDHVFPQDQSSPAGVIGINQMTLLERWSEIAKELDIWYRGLPDSFKPCARLPPITNGSVPSDSPRAIFSEIWYSIPMCASTMQSYHMARTILLINKPHESTARRSTLTNRLHSYRSIEMEVRHHSHEICGIALGRPEGSVRIHQVQPLFVSGQCLTDDRERRIILDLLRGVEADLGWATNYRVQQLLKEWQWTAEPT